MFYRVKLPRFKAERASGRVIPLLSIALSSMGAECNARLVEQYFRKLIARIDRNDL